MENTTPTFEKSFTMEILYSDKWEIKFIPYKELVDFESMTAENIDTMFRTLANAVKKELKK